MRFKWFFHVCLCALLASAPLASYATDTHVQVPDSGSAKVRMKSFTRSSDSQVVQMQLFQPAWLELDFGSTNNCAATSGACDSTSAGQIFNEATADVTSQVIALNGSNLANYIAIACECDDSDVDFALYPGFVHKNATVKVPKGSRINFDNSLATFTGFTTLETSFRDNGMVVLEVTGAKEIKLFLDITAGATPRVSCWYSRL